MGWIVVGMGAAFAPEISLAKDFSVFAAAFELFGDFAVGGSAFPFFAANRFFLSALATASASQGAFTAPGDAAGPLFHSAESASPPICAIERRLITDVSNRSMS